MSNETKLVRKSIELIKEHGIEICSKGFVELPSYTMEGFEVKLSNTEFYINISGEASETLGTDKGDRHTPSYTESSNKSLHLTEICLGDENEDVTIVETNPLFNEVEKLINEYLIWEVVS